MTEGASNGSLTYSYSYDNNGNITDMGNGTTLSWDYENQLVSSTNGTNATYYQYDAEGNRTRKVFEHSDGTKQKETIYVSGREFYYEYSTSDIKTLEKETYQVMDDKQRIGSIEHSKKAPMFSILVTNTTNRYNYSDHLNSSAVEADETGNVISLEEYYVYGGTAYHTKSNDISQKKYRFNGKEKDDETGLYYYGARYYAPWLCRWVSCDPIGMEGSGLNMYWFCSGNPISRIDLDGMSDGFTDANSTKILTDKEINRISAEVDYSLHRDNFPHDVSSDGDQRIDSYKPDFDYDKGKFLGWKNKYPQEIETYVNKDGSESTSYHVIGMETQILSTPADLLPIVSELKDIGGLVISGFKSLFKNSGKIRNIFQKNASKSNKNLLFSVDESMKSADIKSGVLNNNTYIKNPTSKLLKDIINNSGRIGSKQMSGEFMYVVDKSENLIIGTRAGTKMPHPTLIGGKNPQVIGAGIIDIRGGKIYKIDNVSGHFKPSSESLSAVKQILDKMDKNIFHKKFQGYLEFK